MSTRDSKGRFSKGDYLRFSIPSVKTLLSVCLLFLILMPWMVIISRFQPFEKLNLIFETIMGINKTFEESETPIKN